MFSLEGKSVEKVIIGIAVTLGLALSVLLLSPGPRDIRPVIVQGESIGAVTRAIAAVGGEVTHDLHIVNAVGARLDQQQAETITRMRGSSAFRAMPR